MIEGAIQKPSARIGGSFLAKLAHEFIIASLLAGALGAVGIGSALILFGIAAGSTGQLILGSVSIGISAAFVAYTKYRNSRALDGRVANLTDDENARLREIGEAAWKIYGILQQLPAWKQWARYRAARQYDRADFDHIASDDFVRAVSLLRHEASLLRFTLDLDADAVYEENIDRLYWDAHDIFWESENREMARIFRRQNLVQIFLNFPAIIFVRFPVFSFRFLYLLIRRLTDALSTHWIKIGRQPRD